MENPINKYCEIITSELLSRKIASKEDIFPLVKINAHLLIKELLKDKIEIINQKLEQKKIRLYGINKEGGSQEVEKKDYKPLRIELKAYANIYAEQKDIVELIELKNYIKENNPGILTQFYEHFNSSFENPKINKEFIDL